MNFKLEVAAQKAGEASPVSVTAVKIEKNIGAPMAAQKAGRAPLGRVYAESSPRRTGKKTAEPVVIQKAVKASSVAVKGWGASHEELEGAVDLHGRPESGRNAQGGSGCWVTPCRAL